MACGGVYIQNVTDQFSRIKLAFNENTFKKHLSYFLFLNVQLSLLLFIYLLWLW